MAQTSLYPSSEKLQKLKCETEAYSLQFGLRFPLNTALCKFIKDRLPVFPLPDFMDKTVFEKFFEVVHHRAVTFSCFPAARASAVVNESFSIESSSLDGSSQASLATYSLILQ